MSLSDTSEKPAKYPDFEPPAKGIWPAALPKRHSLRSDATGTILIGRAVPFDEMIRSN
jgi:hypothetical protein